MTYYLLLKYLHVLGAIVLIGTGSGIAFFMLMAHLSGSRESIATTARSVVIGDFVFTASAVVMQPLTGFLLARHAGYSFRETWLFYSLILYALIGVFWLPVVWMQMEMRRLADEALLKNQPLPQRYFNVFWLWFAFGVPAFSFILIILWLMIQRPA